MTTVRYRSPQRLIGELVSDHWFRWIFRGQENASWTLKTSFHRAIGLSGPDSRQNQRRIEIDSINHFKMVAGKELGMLEEDNDWLQWLFIMQHYGAPTRLLDWSWSPFIGLYFACRDALSSEIPEDGALYCLNPGAINRYLVSDTQLLEPVKIEVHNKDGHDEQLLISNGQWYTRQLKLYEHVAANQLDWPIVLRPKQFDSRMKAQQAAFTCHGSEKDPFNDTGWQIPGKVLNEQGEFNESLEDRVFGSDHMRRFLIPGKWKKQLLKMMFQMNVSEASLFPGLDGIARSIKALLADPSIRMIPTSQSYIHHTGVIGAVTASSGGATASVSVTVSAGGGSMHGK